jgi:dipeptidyl aminopeptidase/acylaminoacyl peptidase
VTEIPVERCIGGRDLTEPRLSPSGDLLGHLVSVAGASSLVVSDLENGSRRVLDTVPAPRGGRGLGGGCWCWAADDTAVVYAAVDGNLWWQPLDGVSRQLTDQGPERVAQAPMVSRDGRFVVFVVDQAEVWRVALDQRGTTLGSPVRIDAHDADFCFDPWVLPDSGAVQWLAWDVPDMPWDAARIERVELDALGSVTGRSAVRAAGAVQQPRSMPDGRLLCIRDDHGWANLWLDGPSGAGGPLVDETLEHGGPTWGLGQRSFAAAPDGRRIAFTRNDAGFGRLCLVDPADGSVVEVARGVHGQLSWSGHRLAALRTGARTPTQIVVYDTTAGSVDAWERTVVDVGPSSDWTPDDLVEPELVTAVAADGAVLHARLYRSDAPDGRLIVWLHGGPTDQWQVTFMPRIAWWRAQGWNVLVPDHRGSSGHGRAYQQALRGRWGDLDVTDVIAFVEAAHQRAWGVPAATALMGGSAGGFTVLGLLAARPDLAAAAVVAYPVADLADLADRSHRFERHYTLSLVGPVPTLEHRVAGDPYVDRSPVWSADRIRTPLLVFHGTDDPVVPLDQSSVLVERIRTAGSEAELVVYPGEGHGFRLPEHQLDEYRRTAEFLRRHIG